MIQHKLRLLFRPRSVKSLIISGRNNSRHISASSTNQRTEIPIVAEEDNSSKKGEIKGNLNDGPVLKGDDELGNFFRIYGE